METVVGEFLLTNPFREKQHKSQRAQIITKIGEHKKQ